MRTIFALTAFAALQFAIPAAAAPIIITSSEVPSYAETGFFTAPNDNRLLHAIGIYEAGTSGGFGPPPDFAPLPRVTRDANIVVESQGGNDVYLVLSSYESVNWIFSGAGASSVRGVLLNGLKTSFVSGLSGSTTIVDRTGASNLISFCTYTYPGPSGGGCDAPTNLLNFASMTFNDQVDSFIGKYSANGFLVTATQTVGGGVPEPATWTAMILGFGLAGAAKRNRRRRLTLLS